MGNPARQLHDVYSAWREAAVNANKPLHSLVRPMDKGAAVVTAAGRLLARIDDVLGQLERDGASVALYRRQYPGWWAPLLRMNVPSNVGPDDVIPGPVLDQIEGLANFLDGKVFVLDDTHEESLRALVGRVRKVLEDDSGLDEELRQYIHRLLQSIEIALDDDAIGLGFDAASATRQLWVALRAAEGAGTERAPVWRDLWLQMTAGTIAGTAVEAGKVVIGAITGTA